jgi:thiol-disulfide isomerase/thioredoxin
MTRRIAIGLTFLALAGTATAQESVKLKGRVVDKDGKPVAGVEVAPFWGVAEDGSGKQTGFGATKTDAEGRFAATVDFYGRAAALMAFDAARTSGGLAVVSPKDANAPVEIRLGPVVRVHGTFESKLLDKPPIWTNVYVNLKPGNIRLIQASSRKAEFSLRLPAGEYDMHGYGSDVTDIHQSLTLAPDRPDLDLGAIELPASVIAQNRGKVPPAWSVADARGAKKDVTLADYRGKWVLVDFWGYWCGPCVRQLGELIDFYDDHAGDRDKFEVIAFHDGSVKDFSEMDAKNAETKRTLWHGRDLPFPVLLDAQNGERGATVKTYGLTSFPTTILIDPQGKLVGQALIQTLEEKLPPIPLARRVSRALDRDIALGLDSGPLKKNVEFLGRFARIPIKFDDSAGVGDDAKVPLTMTGSVSLRSWLELLLDPLGLEAVPGEDGLVIARAKDASAGRELSKNQKECAVRIGEKLGQKVSFDFKDATLSQVAQHFEAKTQENFVLDPAGRKSGAIDPEATVTGSAKDVPLREALETLLRPLGLKVVVKDEVVVLAKPAARATP